MKKIIEKFNNLPLKLTNDCRLTSFSDLLWFNNIDINEYILFILGEGLNFSLGKIVLPQLEGIELWCSAGSQAHMDRTLIDNLKLPSKIHYFDNETAIDDIIKFINNDIPLLCLFNGNYLEDNYNEVSERGFLSHIRNMSYALIVGYDTNDAKFYINYRYAKKMSPLMQTDISELMKHRNIPCFPISPENKIYEITINETYKKWLHKNLNFLLLMSLEKICKKMKNESDEKVYFDLSNLFAYEGIDSNKIEFGFGLNAIRTLIAEIKNFKSETIFRDNKIFILKMLALRNLIAQGSSTASRAEFGKALKEASKVLRNEAINIIGDSYCNLALEWRKLLRYLFHVRKGINDKDEYIEKVIKLLQYIAIQEELLIKKLQKSL